MRLTSESIMKSFLNSGKKHIIITGSKGHGKSTLLHELTALLVTDNRILPGITTYLVPEECVKLRDNLTGEEALIGEFVEGKGHRRVRAIENGFRLLGVKALQNAIKCHTEWASIDEIGFLESREETFKESIRELLNKKRVLCSIRKQNLDFLNELKNRQDVYVIDVDVRYKKIGCVIMASGQGKRFGSNKLLADFHGKPLYQRTIDIIGDRLFDKIVVVTRTNEIYESALKQGLSAILHEYTDRSDVVRLGIEKMQDMDACVFCPCDQPLLKKESLEHLVKNFCNGKGTIIRLAWKESPGTPILFDKKYFGELMALPEKKGGSYLAEKYKNEVVLAQVSDKKELIDIDTREDMIRLNVL